MVAIHVLLLLSPPLQLTDLFNYLGYARLGVAPRTEPVHARDRRRGPRSDLQVLDLAQPAQPVRTAVHRRDLSAADRVAVGLLLAAEGRHGAREPRFPRARYGSARASSAAIRAIVLVLVALNPIYMMYAVGGFHNDFFMLVPSMAAIALVTARVRDDAGHPVARILSSGRS